MEGQGRQLEVLTTIYAAERQDGNNMEIISMTALGFGLSYVSLSVVGTDYLSGDRLGWLLTALPLPVLVVVAWHSVFLAMGVLRAKSVTLLENELMARAGLEIDEDQMGTRAIESVMNVEHKDATWGARVTLLFGYAGAAAVALGYTAACLVRGLGSAHPVLLVLATLVYAGVAICVTSNYRTAIQEAGSSVLSAKE